MSRQQGGRPHPAAARSAAHEALALVPSRAVNNALVRKKHPRPPLSLH